jgi:uncharacterized lipoprotein YehR (DUF1307 family)
MKSPTKLLATFLALALSVVVVGCDRTVTKSQNTSVSDDGTVRSKETTVTEKSDGTLEKKVETKKVTPVNP